MIFDRKCFKCEKSKSAKFFNGRSRICSECLQVQLDSVNAQIEKDKKLRVASERAKPSVEQTQYFEMVALTYNPEWGKCPDCEKELTRVKGRTAFQCPECTLQYYPLAGTIFEKTNTPLEHWFWLIVELNKRKVVLSEIMKHCEVSLTTAIRMRLLIKSTKFSAYRDALLKKIEQTNKDKQATGAIPLTVEWFMQHEFMPMGDAAKPYNPESPTVFKMVGVIFQQDGTHFEVIRNNHKSQQVRYVHEVRSIILDVLSEIKP